MERAVALCADEMSVRHPELLGLAGESLLSQPWLKVFSSGEELRRYLASDRQAEEVWVASCEDVEPINVAASVKADGRGRRVHLISAGMASGSEATRAMMAGLDPSLSLQQLVQRYAWRKSQAASLASGMQEGGARKRPPARDVERTAPLAQGGASAVCPRSAEATRSVSSGRLAPPAQPAQATRIAPPVAAPRPTRSAQSAQHVQQAQPFRQAQPARPEQPAQHAQPPRPAPPAQPALRPQRAFVLPVVSGSGGAGKSTVAVVAAFLCQRMGYRTLLADFDLQFGDMARLSGEPDAMAVDDLVANPARIESLRPADDAPAVLAAPRRLEDSEAVVASMPAVIKALAGRFDVIVANTGAFWAEQHAVLLESSSRTLFLVDQRPSSLEACRHALDLCARCGIATGPFVFGVNRAAKNALFSSVDVSCALNGSYALELAFGGADVEELVGAGYVRELLRDGNALSASVERMLIDVLPDAEGRLSEASHSGARRGARGRRSARRRTGVRR